MKMSKITLFIGAVVMVILGVIAKNECSEAVGFGLMWISVAIN